MISIFFSTSTGVLMQTINIGAIFEMEYVWFFYHGSLRKYDDKVMIQLKQAFI